MTNATLWGTHVDFRLCNRRENARTTERGVHDDVLSGEVTAYPSSDKCAKKRKQRRECYSGSVWNSRLLEIWVRGLMSKGAVLITI